MTDGAPGTIEARLQELTEAVERLERRVGALEGHAPASRGAAARAGAGPAGRGPAGEAAALAGALPLAGRSFLVLAGAFVLRAVTDAGRLPPWLGVALGLALALALLALADRAGRGAAAGGPARASAVAHGLTAALVGFPLVFEAATRFRLLDPGAAALTLAALAGPALAVSARRRLPALAWIAALGALATALALAAASGRFAPATLVLVAVGTATLWMGYVLDWYGPRWPVAVAADLAALALAARAARGTEDAGAALLVLGILLAAYLGSVAVRTLILQRAVVPFEVFQAAAALAVGLGGAALLDARTEGGAAGFGVAALLLASGAYGVAFAFADRRDAARANFRFYAGVALLLALCGSGLLLSGAARAIAWAALGLGAALLARRLRRATLAVHAALAAAAAALAGGLVTGAAVALAGPAEPPGAAALAVLALVLATAWRCAGAVGRATRAERAPQLVLVGVAAAGLCGAAVGLAAPALAGSPAGLSAARTAALVAGVLALAALGRRPEWLEASWLTYPVLGLAALQLLVDAVPHGRPATLVPAFALFGLALLAVPRLRRRRVAPPAPATVR
ncbi:hypothetical protein [Anaeromyxobacter dehalogenans]|uniref:DUF2339 domain-containing protein n=1 Tax=Anaeromyxobacter dehalogenans (strain 2CP-C) TaxID=290397 RepID=Q2IE48_ANADE|nr:hypothetical protein [Anaeromyxobacter dehalogenans]ABC82858.1 hypothetical protein Adeh_3089 [Anaeromyxobacter dehalogenans 2CP-C]